MIKYEVWYEHNTCSEFQKVFESLIEAADFMIAEFVDQPNLAGTWYLKEVKTVLSIKQKEKD